MGTEERSLEVTLISAQELKKVSNFGSDMCYAVVYTRARDKIATMVDKKGGSNPTWNSKVTLSCDESLFRLGALIMTVEIYSHGSFSNKLVGVSKIPLSDVDKQTQRPTPTQYEVRRPSGKVRGFLTLTVVAGEKRKVPKNSPMVYPPAWMPDSGNLQSTAPYLPPQVSYGVNTGSADSVFSPPRASGNSNGSSGSSSKVEEPVMAYPATGYGGIGGGMQYPPQQYGPQYPGAPQYYPPAQANVPYSYEQAYYGRPPRRQGGSGMGMGLLGGALGGLLLGDMIGDMGGF